MRNEKGQYIKGNIPWSKSQRGVTLNTGKTHFKKGVASWNKEIRGIHLSPDSEFKKGHQLNKGRKHTEEEKLNISKWQKENNIKYWLGKKRPGISGENNNRWKGGITPLNHTIRQSIKYKLWRTAVFERDLYTCQDCGQSGVYLEADHIKSFALFPELRFEVSNGKTLCKPCHRVKTNGDIKQNWNGWYGDRRIPYGR